MNPNDTSEGVEPWGSINLAEGEERELVLGPLTLHVVRRSEELRLAWERNGATAEAPSAEPAEDGVELDWSRWATRGWEGNLHLVPVFPDRPLVVAPEEPFHLMAGAEARIYVRVPLWVELSVGSGRKRSTVLTLPTIPASDTWWGTVEEGELCYWLRTVARSAVSDDLFEHHLAMCPLQLVNRSEDDLTVDKIAVRVDYLSLYSQGGRIWADETRVRYQGDAEGSRLEMAGKPPREAPDARPLTEARLQMGRGFRARTFARLRAIPGWMA